MQTSRIHNSGEHMHCFENCHKRLGFIILYIVGIDFSQPNDFASSIEIHKYMKRKYIYDNSNENDIDGMLNGSPHRLSIHSTNNGTNNGEPELESTNDI